MALMVLVLSAFLAIAAYSGTSMLFGSFLAGTFLTYLPSDHPDGPFVVTSREHGEEDDEKSPTFFHTFEAFLHAPLRYVLEPLFFASIGYAIPFINLWKGSTIWRGVLYALLMLVGKVSTALLSPGSLTYYRLGCGWTLDSNLAYEEYTWGERQAHQSVALGCCARLSYGSKRRDWPSDCPGWL